MQPTRRQWLERALGVGVGAVALAGSRDLLAAPPIDLFGDLDEREWNEPSTVLTVDLPQLQYAGRWNPRPGAMRWVLTSVCAPPAVNTPGSVQPSNATGRS